MKTSLLGYGAHGRDIEAIWLRANPSKSLSIFDDDPTNGMYPPPEVLPGKLIIGVNDPHTRLRIAERYDEEDAAPALIDPSAIIGTDIKIGDGSVIGPQATLLRSVRIGRHVHINYGVTMTRCHIKAYATVAPGVTICGDVKVGHRTFVGAGATISNLVTIGHDCVIGAGAIVLPNTTVPDGTRVIGVWK